MHSPIQSDKPLYSSRTIDPYIKLIKARYPYVDIEEIYNYAGIEPWEAADQSHWFTQTQINMFYEQAVKLTGNPDLAREAGRYIVHPDTFGFVRTYALSFINPHTMFNKIGDIISQLTKSSNYYSRKLSDTSVEIVVTPNPGVTETPAQCENRLGVFEAGIQTFNYKLEAVDHPECMFRGGRSCRYIVRWQVSESAKLKRYQNISMAVLPLLNLPLVFFYPLALLASIPVSVGICLTFAYKSTKADLEELSKGLENLAESRDQLLEQLDVNYNNAMLTSELGHAISSLESVDTVLESIIEVLQNRLDFDRGMIMLADENKTRLSYRAGFGHDDKHRFILQRATFRLDNPDSRGVFVESFKEQAPFLVNDFESFERRHTTHSVNIAKALEVKSFVCCPIICEGESLGVLAVDNLKSSRPLMQRDKSLLMGIAPVIGVAIRNAEYMLAKDREFRSTLQVLAASIDARDPMTAGHSEKVTEYTVGICNEMGLDLGFIECVRVASLLHDYGKIGVPDAILKKNGRLNEEEYEIIKTHSVKTKEILSQINFQGKYRDVPEIAGAHHEKWNGNGYPNGLEGEDIHLGARIIAVADFFEAITSKRHYREPMPLQVALDLVEEQKGSSFDPHVVDAFMRYLKTNNDKGPFGQAGPGGEDENLCTIRDPRVTLKSPVDIKLSEKTFKGQIQDLSCSGVYLSMPEDVEKGVDIKITFNLPGYDRPLVAEGRIAWVNMGERRPKPHYPDGAGVKFTSYTSPCAQYIKDYVTNYLPEEQKKFLH